MAARKNGGDKPLPYIVAGTFPRQSPFHPPPRPGCERFSSIREREGHQGCLLSRRKKRCMGPSLPSQGVSKPIKA